MCFANAQPIDYSPCTYGPFSKYKKNVVRCNGSATTQVFDAIRRNKDNSDIDALYLWNMDDLTDKMLDEILQIIASSASQNVVEINLRFLPKVKKAPGALQRFPNIHWFNFNFNDGLNKLPFGAVNFSSDSVNEINCYNNPNLEEIELGAFQGDFSNGIIFVLRENSLKRFDEAVFRPMLSNSSTSVIVTGNPIACDCSLAWILRDNRQYLNQVIGDCRHSDGKTSEFTEIDPTMLKDC